MRIIFADCDVVTGLSGIVLVIVPGGKELNVFLFLERSREDLCSSDTYDCVSILDNGLLFLGKDILDRG